MNLTAKSSREPHPTITTPTGWKREIRQGASWQQSSRAPYGLEKYIYRTQAGRYRRVLIFVGRIIQAVHLDFALDLILDRLPIQRPAVGADIFHGNQQIDGKLTISGSLHIGDENLRLGGIHFRPSEKSRAVEPHPETTINPSLQSADLCSASKDDPFLGSGVEELATLLCEAHLWRLRLIELTLAGLIFFWLGFAIAARCL